MQNRDVTMIDVPTEAPNQVICRLAKEAVHAKNRFTQREKIDELRQFLLSGHSVDADLYRNPPTGILMEQNEEAAALFLVNHFNANPSWIAYHYARQQRLNEALEIANTYDAELTYRLAYRLAITGFVDGMNTSDASQVEMLFDFLAGMGRQHHYINTIYAARALASKGNQEIILDLTLYYKVEECHAIDIYIYRKDAARVDKILQRHPNLSTHAVQLYLATGQMEEARQLILVNHNVDINQVIITATLLAEDALVDELLGKGASINEAVKGYAFAGNIDKVNTLLASGANPHSAFNGLLQGRHSWLIDNYFSNEFLNRAFNDTNFNSFSAKKMMAFVQDDNHRKALSRIRLPWTSDAYSNSTWRRKLMQDFYLDYEQATFIQCHSDPRVKRSFIYYLHNRHMTFEQARAMIFGKNVKAWYKQASQLSSHGLLNDNITALVASYAYELPLDDAETLRTKIAPTTYKPTLFASPASREKQQPNKRQQENQGGAKRPKR